MSKRVLGSIPWSLSRILDLEGGSIASQTLRDGEGISIVYDIGQLIAGELLSYDQRWTELTNIGASESILITDLPRMFRILGVTISVSDATDLEYAALSAVNFGPPGTFNSDLLLWSWQAGDTTIVRPAGFDTSFTESTLLIPSINNLPFTFKGKLDSPLNQGITDLRFHASDGGSNTPDIQCVVFLGFWVSQRASQGQAALSLAPPSW